MLIYLKVYTAAQKISCLIYRKVLERILAYSSLHTIPIRSYNLCPLLHLDTICTRELLEKPKCSFIYLNLGRFVKEWLLYLVSITHLKTL